MGPARMLGGPLIDRYRNIARSVQSGFEDRVLHLVRRARDRRPGDAVCRSGGAVLNSVAIGRIGRGTAFERMFDLPAPSDSGGACPPAESACAR